MEIGAESRPEVRIDASDVGKRVSVRSVAAHPVPGAKFTDTVGILTSWDAGTLVVTRRSGERVTLRADRLVAGKAVPAAPARRRGPAASFAELTRVSARAWEPVESEPLGGWTLRAAAGEPDAAGRRRGFTRRANSLLPLGEPGLPVPVALERAREWYARRGLPAYAQLGTGAEAEGAQERLAEVLVGEGWVSEVSALVMTGPLAPLADVEPRAGAGGGGADPWAVRLSRVPGELWLRRYNRSPGRPGPEVLAVLGSGPSTWFATVAGESPAEGPAAIGRLVVDGRWAGFSAVEVAPELRRRGLAGQVMAALAGQALAEGASASWLQVETGNEAALALYTGRGFAPHHHYHHYRAPGPVAP